MRRLHPATVICGILAVLFSSSPTTARRCLISRFGSTIISGRSRAQKTQQYFGLPLSVLSLWQSSAWWLRITRTFACGFRAQWSKVPQSWSGFHSSCWPLLFLPCSLLCLSMFSSV